MSILNTITSSISSITNKAKPIAKDTADIAGYVSLKSVTVPVAFTAVLAGKITSAVVDTVADTVLADAVITDKVKSAFKAKPKPEPKTHWFKFNGKII